MAKSLRHRNLCKIVLTCLWYATMRWQFYKYKSAASNTKVSIEGFDPGLTCVAGITPRPDEVAWSMVVYHKTCGVTACV